MPSQLRLMRHAFPDFPVEEVPQHLRDTWDDTSYGHDLCPSFSPMTCPELKVWVNRLNPADRYDGPTSPRFSAGYDPVDGDGADTVWLYQGDDEGEMMKTIFAFYKGLGL